MFGRFFDKLKKGRSSPEPQEVPVDAPTIGLCFDYGRGIDYSSESLSDEGLDRILKVLKKRHLRATFNCPAKLCEKAPRQITTIAEAGHEIGVMGYADETPKDFSDEALKQLVFSCRNAFAKLGISPLGFYTADDGWDPRLGAELARQHFRYNAEHDHAKNMYLLLPPPSPIVRIPIRTDDRGLRRSEKTVDATISKHLRAQRRAIREGNFLSICFHPWILAEAKDRMDHWRSWLDAGIRSGARIVALEDALPDEYRKPPPTDDEE